MDTLRIFVTGANGFVGRHLVHALKRRYPTARIKVLVRSAQPTLEGEVVVADISDIEKYRADLCEADVIFHLAANAQFGSQFDYQAENVEPLKSMITALQDSRKRDTVRFVFVSSIGAFDRAPLDGLAGPIFNDSIPNPRSAYGRSKLDGEILLKASGLKYTIVRPSWIYGAGMRTDSHVSVFAAMLERSLLLSKFAFPGKVSLVHVRDLTEGLARIPERMETVNRDYFVATEECSIGDLLGTLAEELTGKRVKQIYVPSLGPARWLHSLLPIQVTNLFNAYLTCESELFWRDTGYSPSRMWRDNLAEVSASTSRRRMFVVITGANSGIGLALAQNYRHEGRNLILIDKQTDQLDGFVSDSIHVFKVDLSDKKQLADLTEKLRNFEIAILVNNAGLGFRGDFADMNIENIENMVAVNMSAPLLLTRGVLPQLKRTKASIVNVTSSTAIHPLPHMSIYAATKSFLRNWSLSLSEELKATNHVLTFAPSGTRTNFQVRAGVKADASQSLHTPEFVADKIQTAIGKNLVSVNIGFAATVLNFVSFFLPIRVRLKLWSFLFQKQR